MESLEQRVVREKIDNLDIIERHRGCVRHGDPVWNLFTNNNVAFGCYFGNDNHGRPLGLLHNILVGESLRATVCGQSNEVQNCQSVAGLCVEHAVIIGAG